MPRFSGVLSLLLLLAAPVALPSLAAQHEPTVLAALPHGESVHHEGQVTAPVPILDPNKAVYPRSSLHDFGDLQDAPAGKYGFMTVRGEHFYWPNGKRARFWGINVANTTLQQPDASIDAMIANFKSAGFNLVRLHHFDERDGIIDLNAPDSRHFLPERLKKLDYWIYKAKQSGMYVYLDLLDYRHFKAGDGVPNAEAIGRSAKPYAVFDARLMELQKEYARKLLRDHVNPYTGLAYADDPAVAMVELYDENGLFMRRGLWRSMPAPYAGEFSRLWNQWLKKRYKSTGELMNAWTDGTGKSALLPGESLEKGNVGLPAMTWTPRQLKPADLPYAALPRRDDGALFGYEVQRRFFRELKGYVRDTLGVRVPICATGRYDDMADLRSMSEEMDFIGCNFYYDHPYWANGTPQWQLPSYYRNENPLHDIDERSMAAATSLARIKGKPFVVREWNYCWPNHNRASGMIEAAVYATLHDYDAMILFGYEMAPTARLSYFNVRSDPTRWGLAGVGAQIFLKGLVEPSRHRIVVPYNVVDTFTYTKYHQPLYALGWATRMENDFFDGGTYVAPPGTDLMVIPGRSGVGQYSNAPAVLYTGSLAHDLAGRTLLAPEYLRPYGLETRTSKLSTLSYDGLLFDEGTQQERALPLGISLASLRTAGLRAIGSDDAGGIANGFIDPQRKRLVFGSLLDQKDVLRAALDGLSLFCGVPNNHDETNQNAYRSDTGEIFRDAGAGRMVVSAPGFQALCGNLAGVGGLADGLGVRNARNGTLVALALDGKPLVSSRRYVIKMVTDARNVDEVLARDPRLASGQWKLATFGNGPITTDGRASATPLTISLAGRPILDVSLQGGSWELYVDGNERQFFCDTPGTRFTLHPMHNALTPVIARDATPSVWRSVSENGATALMRTVVGADQSEGMVYPPDTAVVRAMG